MDRPHLDQRWQREVANIDSAFVIRWDRNRGRWKVCTQDVFHGVTNLITIHWVQEEDGTFKPFDMRTIRHLREQTWKTRRIEFIADSTRTDEALAIDLTKEADDAYQDIVDDNKHIVKRISEAL